MRSPPWPVSWEFGVRAHSLQEAAQALMV
uniref:Uncharacterized protein n=1 Tax=Arundo donax TaxID=35708 RepID=A0A0A8ZSK9_ARUDO